MGQSASDVRAGGAYYELSGRDALTPVLAQLRANLTGFGDWLSTFSPGAGGAGFFNRLVFGAKDIDAKSGAYLGRVGGLIAPLRALFSPGQGGSGLVNRWLFGTKDIDAKTGEYRGRIGGLIAPLRALFSSGESGSGLINRLVFGDKFSEGGKYVGRVGGILNRLGAMFDSASGGSGLVNRWLFGDKRTDEAGKYVGRVGGLVDLARSAGGAVARTFSSAASSVQQLAAGLQKAGVGLSALGAVGSVPALALFKGGVDRAAGLANMARELGVPIQTLNKFQYAADRAKVSLDEVMNDRHGRYTDLIAQAPDIDPADALAAADAQRQLADATQSLQDALLPLVSALNPYLKMLAAWTKENAHLIAPIGLAAAAVTGLGVALGVAGFAVSGLVAAVGILKGVVVAIGSALLSPWGLAIAAVGALGYAFVTMTDTGRSAFGALKGVIKDEFGGALDTAKSAWGGLANAIKKGDLVGAIEIATTSIELLWAGTVLRMERAWAGFKSYFVDGWHQITGGMGPMLDDLWNEVKGLFDRIVSAAGWLVVKVSEIGTAIWDGIKEPVMRLVNFLAPVLAVLAMPFIALAGLIENVWGGLDLNIMVTLNHLAKWVEKTFERIGTFIGNTFRLIADNVLEAAVKAGTALYALTRDETVKKAVEVVVSQQSKVGKDVRDAQETASGVRVQKIDEKYEKQETELRNAQTSAQLARDEARTDDVRAAAAKANELNKKLKGRTDRAAEPRAPGPPEPKFPLSDKLVPQVNVKGGFSGAALNQQFGVGDQVIRMTELIKNLVAGEGGLPGKIGEAVGAQMKPFVTAPPVIR